MKSDRLSRKIEECLQPIHDPGNPLRLRIQP
jgi:hypothetical protein